MTPERLRNLANKLATNSLFTQDEIDTIKALNEYADALEKCEPVYQVQMADGETWIDTSKNGYENWGNHSLDCFA
jgi:hypothetical protein